MNIERELEREMEMNMSIDLGMDMDTYVLLRKAFTPRQS